MEARRDGVFDARFCKHFICVNGMQQHSVLLLRLSHFVGVRLFWFCGARRDGVFFRVVHSVSDIENLRIDDTSILYHRSCYKTYTSRRNCGFCPSVASFTFWRRSAVLILWSFLSFLKVCFPQNIHSAMSVDVSSVCSFKKGTCDVSGLTAERLQNVKDATEGQNVVACHSRR
jgi:hypothetical protein